ncbi:uncharacterized protein FOMMEDRAFT_114721 [Fomitiporia mediterranea MF3/22]|uniref:uncharacterized protein n=1 Tax=Fomitiporia mediterranea (strain MF3/22) TaxID=694068 RepID=UPI0004408E6C|nr:uncharacterized protein FOMMEDRAFT_114721 [Fomitiporia mediterranea MF3/22]EJC97944.1 hypothetical protein FOMMEDRAFT_114721 [Fomitiporia mediterranea MF3/22]
MEFQEFQESTTVRLEWTVRGLKQLFESSKGESKSKVTKSVKFGGGRWQVLFYPNAGVEGGAFVSLYLSCEPTPEEKDGAIDGKWVRTGLYKFSFELRNLSRTILFNQKEANDHSFSWKTANWGWAQFARREAIYYQPNTVRNSDAFLITCTISSAPTIPSLPSPVPHRSVPKDLLDAIGSLLDDPAYSDVEFVVPNRLSRGRKPRSIFAARSILRRAEYFESMFGSGFAEASSQNIELSSSPSSQSDTLGGSDGEIDSVASSNPRQFEDSDEEDEAELTEVDGESEVADDVPSPSEVEPKSLPDLKEHNGGSMGIGSVPSLQDETSAGVPPASTATDLVEETPDSRTAGQAEAPVTEERIVRAKLSHPSSPRRLPNESKVVNGRSASGRRDASRSSKSLGARCRVVVKDVAYTTYRAVLYYLYTDAITFAPLASSFLGPLSTAGPSSLQTPPHRSQGEGQSMNTAFTSRPMIQNEQHKAGPTTRIAWIREWERQNPGKPMPCSAKAVYRVADKLRLSELKSRAFQHIVKSLTIHNIPYEMFSSFSSTFEDVRKTQIAFFLERWNEIRASQSMQAVWQQIRVGRHPGFEEVWPLIAMNLEFRPRASELASGDSREGNSENPA